ncbi:hypothetical protein RO3G_17297 [Rhizopus delemar RA 99-880]|uniref:RNA polymerase alpha subunit domain-containing protein n=1 Tax=Rhizopus delemar (strain RA 99-880 / ATCC MYA-4621 / FGSC 9543 / NRRL 43880) TaxID=246409 RepID=I1CVV6_RHIO9|nr:hypothetical protein RO3G_17297 [Rhizopus delemar RA 99-880]|eukprot:EIE92586.1 hypothetical protein RO3G_17297 [Rhizopus delemar RA 99-880]
MVSKIEIKPLKVDNLKYVMKDTTAPSVTNIRCVMHEDCQGHLLGNSRGTIVLPSMCVNEDLMTMDERGKLNHQMLSDSISPDDYSRGVRNTLMGKRGMLRHACMGIRPLTTIRGVASCTWTEDPSTVYIPYKWTKDMRIPFRRGGDRLQSPYWAFRGVVDGDYAILIRCPSISDNSCMPVRVYAWDKPSIGVHPAMCEHLNLDFDGDEVHIGVVSSLAAVDEIKSLMHKNPLFNKFRPEVVSDITSRLSNNIHEDFMLHSTLSLSMIDMNDDEVFTPLHSLSRCKRGSWDLLRQRLDMDKTINDDTKNLVPFWFEPGTSLTLPTLEHGDVRNSYGYPGMRLASKISGKIMQGALDTAKHGITTSGEDLILSLLSMSRQTYEILSHGNRTKLMKITPKTTKVGKVLATTSRFRMQMMGSVLGLRSCVSMVACACESMKISYTNSELAHFAALIYYTSMIDPRSPVTDFKPTSFLSKTSTDYLSVGVAENLIMADIGLNTSLISGCMSVESAAIALIIGNFKGIRSRSIRHKM